MSVIEKLLITILVCLSCALLFEAALFLFILVHLSK
jgi:hypothetical protein